MNNNGNNIDRNWSPEFNAYTEMIVSHPNYQGLFYDRDANGKIKWVVTGKSKHGQLRQIWWDKKCQELGIPLQSGCYAIAARRIHPTGRHVCQCCGKELSIRYEYPNKSLLKKLNGLFDTTLQQTDKTIAEIITDYCSTPALVSRVGAMFGLSGIFNKDQLISHIYKDFVEQNLSPLSPGVMSNPPDRFDGFHSDGLCCREKTDKGRHADNMHTYTQDRRAYEEWADGDYNLANRLMGEFLKAPKFKCPKCNKLKKMTADHIGPISLGFCHNKNFAPLCKSCNSSKNNRFTKSDVDTLLTLEANNEPVVSWHAQPIWDMLKYQIKNDIDAKKASSIMATAHQNVLKLFSVIYKHTGTEFLRRYLHPEFSLIDYRFENFDPFHLDKLRIIATPMDSKNKRSNQDRYERVAFEHLHEFDSKQNRRTIMYIDKFTADIDLIIDLIRNNDFAAADSYFHKLIEKLSIMIYQTEWNPNIHHSI